MILLKFKSLVLSSLIVLFTSSCIYGDLNKRAFDEINKISLAYCQDKQLSPCDVYQNCFTHQLTLFKNNKNAINETFSIMVSNTPVFNEQISYNKIMDTIYNSIIIIEQKNPDSNTPKDYSLVLYIHNACTDITGDKKYNIDRYIPLVETKLKNANK